MKTKTLPQTQVRRTVISARELVENLHIWIEQLNLCIAQSDDYNHDTQVKYTRIIQEQGVSHLFECGGQSMTIDFDLNMEGGVK